MQTSIISIQEFNYKLKQLKRKISKSTNEEIENTELLLEEIESLESTLSKIKNLINL